MNRFSCSPFYLSAAFLNSADQTFMMSVEINLRKKSLNKPDIENPFVHDLKLSVVDKIQVVLMSITVAPVRLVVIAILFLIVWCIAVIGTAFRPQEDVDKPLFGWRKSITKPFAILARAIYFVMGFYHVRTKGVRAPAHVAPLLVAAPHSSMFDTLLICVGTQVASPVSRHIQVPFIESLLKFVQPILVQREDQASRMNAVRTILNRSQVGGHWPQIIIFPEGAFFPGVPVQPVCVRYPNKLDTTTWTWQGPSALTLVWLTMCQLYTKCEIEYLPVYKPSKEEQDEPRLFASNVRELMARHLKLPVTEHSFYDCQLMEEAKKLEMPPDMALVEFEKLHAKLGVAFHQIQDLLKQFREISNSETEKEAACCITYEDFRNYLMLPDSEALKEVFALYDRDGSGTIDFREYVIGLSLLSSPVNNDDTLQLAFELFDLDNDGYISQEELQTILGHAFHVSDEDLRLLFHEVNTSGDGKITLDEFRTYAKKKPEYARVFTTYRELKMARNVRDVESKKHQMISDADFEQWGNQVVPTTIKKLQ